MDVTGFTLVIGAGSGTGLETALTFAERGARGVAFADINLHAAHDAAEESRRIAISAKYQALSLLVDVTIRESARKLVAVVQEKFGRIHYAINCAGVVSVWNVDLDNTDENEFDRLYNINCKGILHCLQEEAKVMKAQELVYIRGRSGKRSIGPEAIVNITSMAARIGSPAVETRGSGLRINEVCRSYINTSSMTQECQEFPHLRGPYQ